MDNSLFQVFLLSLLALVFIYIFYYFFKLKWPEIYFAIADKNELIFSYSASRYIALRLIPIFLIISFVLGISRTLDVKSRVYSSLIIGIVYIFFSDITSIKKIAKNDRTVHIFINRIFQITFHAISVILIIAVAALAGYVSGRDEIHLLTPTWNGLVDNIWSSLITIILAVFFYKLYQRADFQTGDLFEKYLKNIDPTIIETIESESRKNMANTDLVRAICIVENIQRPSWVRKIEKLKSYLVPKGTYGIMQVESPRFISDKESVRLAVEKYFKHTKSKKWEEMKDVVQKYNPDIRYVEFVEAAYRHLTGEVNFDNDAPG